MKHLTRNIILTVLLIGGALATWLSRHNPFFWDTIQLASKHAHWYYEHDFRYLLLPDAIDSGHPPGFGMYLALAWKLFGKSLAVSHLAMLPFLLGIVVLLFRVGDYFGGRQHSWMFALLALADPVLAAQSILVSPDLALVFAFLLGLYGILYQKGSAKLIGALLLAAISTRGMMAVVLLYAFELAIQRRWDWRLPLHKAVPYLPSGLLAFAFLYYHYQQKGWIGYHADAPWAVFFERATPRDFAKNLAVLAWRMLDFGRVFLWPLLFWMVYRRLKLSRHLSQPIRHAAWLFALALPLMSYTFLMYKGLHGHRYLLPAFLALTVLFHALLIHGYLALRWRYAFFSLAFAGLLTGNLWVYPDHISQGWDSTLAHLPYNQLRRQMLDYLDERQIPLEEVGTAFPEIGPLDFKELNGQQRGMKPKDLSTDRYIFYSNVMNDFSDEEIRELHDEWGLKKEFHRRGVRVSLFAKAPPEEGKYIGKVQPSQ
jgi:4-amino-4-deoxy-L-arabinose transferase-like glycosyltransferase